VYLIGNSNGFHLIRHIKLNLKDYAAVVAIRFASVMMQFNLNQKGLLDWDDLRRSSTRNVRHDDRKHLRVS